MERGKTGACLVGDELGGNVTAIDAHALLHLHHRLQAAAALYAQHSIRAHLVQGIRNHLAH